MWKFKELEIGVPERDPHETEFFRLTEPTEAIVREFIQNSLDAIEPGENRIKVRFKLGFVGIQEIKGYFNTLKTHFGACDFPQPDYKDPDVVPFITIEDFHTTGLNGATGEDGIRPGKGSNFFDFWWREGMSGKSGREAGRWGLGKTTFHLASKFRSFWGFTVRDDDKRELLMGKALLKTHKIDDVVYHYYGYFTAEGSRPIEDNLAISDFKQKFSISRNKETGFSLVIPFPDDDITTFSIIRAVIIHYYFAIMKGALEVEIIEDGNCTNLSAENLIDKAHSLDWRDTSWEGINVLELLQFVKDAIHVSDIIELVISDDWMPDIVENSFGDKFSELKNLFNNGVLLSFKIPVKIKRIGCESMYPTYFKLHVKKSPQLKQAEECYIRSGITISDIKTLGNRSVRGLFVAEDVPITTFLGDSETPAHTEWNERTEDFKNTYEHASRILRFIRRSMGKIVSLLDQPPQEQQRNFLQDIFFLPEQSLQRGVIITSDRPQPPTPKPSLFVINRIMGGFKMSLNRSDISLPIRTKITAAYDVRRGNPFNRYEPYDFDLESDSISITSTGCDIMNKNRNKMEVKITNNDFNLEIKGFDVKRDLVISVKEEIE